MKENYKIKLTWKKFSNYFVIDFEQKKKKDDFGVFFGQKLCYRIDQLVIKPIRRNPQYS